jgi:hypothetical protein
MVHSENTQVKPYALKPYAAKGYNGDPQTLYTTWTAYVPNNQVDSLQLMINARQSRLYTDETGTAAELADHIIPAFPVRYNSDPTSQTPGSSGPGNSPSNQATALSSASTQRRNAIIGVVAAIGGIALIVLGWWLIKSYKRRQEAAHTPLGDEDPIGHRGAGGYGATEQGMRERPPSVGPDGVRRNSFYFAEDSLRGYTDPNRMDEVEQPGGSSGGRRPIGGQPISGPVLRQNTLGY